MISISHEEFQKLMEDAISSIPGDFKDKLDNLVFIAEDYPSDTDLSRLNLKNKYTLLGLYSGVPFTHRNTGYSGVSPDIIILFQRNIEAQCSDSSQLKEKIVEVVIHEIAHYFGLDDKQIREAGY